MTVERRIHSPGGDPLIDGVLAKTQEAPKGFLQMTGDTIHAIGTEDQGIEQAMVFLSRFQSLAVAEGGR